MTSISIPYGKGVQTLKLPEERLRGVLKPAEPEESNRGEEEIVREALQCPVASSRLSELASGKHRVLVITSDHTRPVPSRITLPLLLIEIRKGNPDAEIKILIATGMHRPTTQEELRAKMGDAIVEQETIVVHEAEKDADMVTLGTLPSGGVLKLNKLTTWADLIVAEGFIEPHFFAGFSGGRKSILPGIAARETVLYNHNARFLANPLATQGNLEGNPLHRDMLFAAQTAGLRFILNVLIDEDKRIIAAYAGEPEAAHAAGCEACLQRTRVTKTEADIVITSNGGYPLDQNVYQSVKGMTAAESCVRPGGVIIMCSALGDGHGGEAFHRWFADRESPQTVAREIAEIPPEATCMDQWEAQILARVLCKAAVFFVTGIENRDLIRRMHMHWEPDVNTALAEATKRLGQEASVVVIPDGVGVVVQ